MKAVAYKTPGPIDRDDALQDITLETPKAENRDLLTIIEWIDGGTQYSNTVHYTGKNGEM